MPRKPPLEILQQRSLARHFNDPRYDLRRLNGREKGSLIKKQKAKVIDWNKILKCETNHVNWDKLKQAAIAR